MQRLPKPVKEFEELLEKAYNDSVREKIWENTEKIRRDLVEITKGK